MRRWIDCARDGKVELAKIIYQSIDTIAKQMVRNYIIKKCILTGDI